MSQFIILEKTQLNKKAVTGPFFPQANGGSTISIAGLAGEPVIITISKVPEWEGSDHVKLSLTAGGVLFTGDYWVPEDESEVVNPEFTLPVEGAHIGKPLTAWYNLNNEPESERVSVLVVA